MVFKRKDENDKPIWEAQYANTNPNDLNTGKFGFNVLVCFASAATNPQGGDGMHQLYSVPEAIHAEKGEEVRADQYIDFVQYDPDTRNKVANTIYLEYKDSLADLGSDDAIPELYLSHIDYEVKKSGDAGDFVIDKNNYALNTLIDTIDEDGNLLPSSDLIENIEEGIGKFTNKWSIGYTTGSFDESGTYIWEYDSKAKLVPYANGILEPVSLKTSYAKTLIVISSNDTQYLRWYNQPLAFAEVKDKTWSGDRTSETWEAMAGIPTTETFYINAGGTPVFCDIKAKYTETSFSKNYNETYTHTWMVGDELVRCTCTDVQPRTFNISYITIESVTLRTSEKAILNNAKIFVDEKQEVPISSPVTYKADGSNEYYIDARGTSINSNAYGVDDEKEAWSESGGGSEHRAAKLLKGHMEEITVFRNSDKVKIWIEGEEYEILVGKRDKDNVYNNSATLTVSISDQWKPTSPDGTYIWDKNTKIPFVGYIGQPQAGDGRNIGSPDVPEKLRFYKTEVKIPLNEVNGYYDFVDRFDEQYMEYSEAFALIKDNLNTEPDEQPVLEYIDYKSTPSAPHTLDQVDGISVNSVIIHNPVSAQDIWIHQTPNQDLEDQRVNRNNYKQPKTYIDFTFGITIPNTGSFEINELKNNQTDLNANSLLKVEQAPGVLGKSFVGKYKLAFNIAERNKNYPSSIPDANNLDTSLWIRAKYIRLPFNAYYNSKLYQKNTWITLYDQGRDEAKTGDPTQFPIYITSDNPDMASARIFYVNEAINAPEDLAGKPDKLYADAEKNANTLRDSGGKYNDLEGDNVAKLSARHSARYSTTQDVIGRIGNIIVDDSSEPRYTNVFWKPDKTKPLLDFLFWPLIEPGGNFYSLYYNMFEEKTIKSSAFDNRWGTLSDYHDAAAYRQGDIPVTKTSNPSGWYAQQAIKMGYSVQFSVQTLGSYGDGVIRITYSYSD